MTEYIKREPLLQIARQLQSDDAFGTPRIIREIENAPAEDVVEVDRLDLILKLQHDKSLENLKEYLQKNDIVEVTRCKDCKWWRDKECTNVNGARGYVPNPNWFCGSGERRTNNE